MRDLVKLPLVTALLSAIFIASMTGAVRADGGRPHGCPHAWCGCWLGIKLDMRSRALWLARAWSSVGTRLNGPRECAVAVWLHHVGFVKAVRPGEILLVSGNDGHRVRERWRSSRGVIAWRDVGRCLN